MQLLAWITDFFWPLTCLGCRTASVRLCRTCQMTLRGASQHARIDGLPVIAAGIMRTSLLSRAVWELKYRHAQHLAPALGTLMACALLDAKTSFKQPIILPVPLHPRRLRRRGYNQSALLAQQLSHITAWETRADVLVRTRSTKSQVETKSREDRLRNMQEAFAVRDQIAGRHILLVDDVCTTGATLLACRAALLAAGAANITAVVVARG